MFLICILFRDNLLGLDNPSGSSLLEKTDSASHNTQYLSIVLHLGVNMAKYPQGYKSGTYILGVAKHCVKYLTEYSIGGN